MGCTRLPREYGPAPLMHRMLCPECRASARSDAAIGLTVGCLRAAPTAADRLADMLIGLGLDAASASRQSRRVPLGLRALRPIAAGLCGMAVVGVVGWTSWADRDPRVPVPLAATAERVGSGAFERAHDAIVGRPYLAFVSRNWMSPGASNSPDDSARDWKGFADVVRANARPLSLLRAGLASRRREIPRPAVQPADTGHYSRLACLAAMASASARLEKRWRTAMSFALDAMELGAMVPASGGQMARIAGTDCEYIGARQAWQCLDHLTGTECASASARLGRIAARRMSFAATINADKWSLVAALQSAMARPGWRDAGISRFPWYGGAPVNSSILDVIKRRRYTKRQVVGNMIRAMDDCARMVEWCTYSDGQFMPVAASAAAQGEYDWLTESLAPDYTALLLRNKMAEAEAGMLRVALAVRAYRGTEGRLPERMAALVPQYLPDLVADPFAFRMWPLKYRQEGRSYRLYSIGPDGSDDGGRPLRADAATPAARRAITTGERGDITEALLSDVSVRQTVQDERSDDGDGTFPAPPQESHRGQH